MILCVKVRLYRYEENKKNDVKPEFDFDGLGVWRRDPSGFRLLRSLYDYLNGLHPLFMKDFALTGRTSRVFQFFHFVVLSFIRDMLIRSHKNLIVYNFLVNYIAIYRAQISRGE
jgi:hypothetical protein